MSDNIIIFNDLKKKAPISGDGFTSLPDIPAFNEATTTGSKDTKGVLYNSSKSKLTENDDISSSNRNFKIEYYLTNGQTVYVGVKYYSTSDSGIATLSISKKDTPVKPATPVFNLIMDPWNRTKGDKGMVNVV